MAKRPKTTGHHSPYAVVYGGSKLHSPPNPFRNDVTLHQELWLRGGELWDTDIATLDDALLEAQAAGRAHKGRVVVYDQSTGESVHQQSASGARSVKRRQVAMKGTTKLQPKKLEPWSGPERWEKTHEGDHIWVEILPFNDETRMLRNDQGDRWTEPASEIEAHRRRLRSTGSTLVKLGAPVLPSSRTTSSGEVGELAGAILDAAYELGRGKTDVPIRITELRSRVGRVVPHHRTDFDEAVLKLFHQRRIVLSRQDNTFALTPDDREDAVYVGDNPRHLIYLLEAP